MTKVLTILSILILSLAAQAQSVVPGTVEYQDTREDGKAYVVIRITGALAYPMASELDEKIAALPPKVPLMLHLNSGGGSLREGLKMIGSLRNFKKERQLITLVRNGEVCGSMCVPLYVQGDRRLAGEVAAFMFHGATPNGYTNIPDQKKSRDLTNMFVDAGVSTEWIESLWAKKVFSVPGEFWISGLELVEEKSKVVTELVSRHVQYEPWVAPIDPTMGPK